MATGAVRDEPAVAEVVKNRFSHDAARGIALRSHPVVLQAQHQAKAAELRKFSDTFKSLSGVKKGDVILGDWVPGTGTVLTLNGKPMTEAMPEPLFYNALLRIWLGRSPADVLLTVDAGNLAAASEAGLLQPLRSDVVTKTVPSHYRDAQG